MRLRTFTGRTMSEAMSLVRDQLGPEAVIVSTQTDPEGGMRVTAALELEHTAAPPPAPDADVIDILGDALAWHGTAPELIEKILTAALPFDGEEPLVALSSALAFLFGFAPATVEGPPRALLLAGPPGAGKTVTIAKLAARAVLAGVPVRLITADDRRAGGIEQLETFAKILKLPFAAVSGAAELAAAATRPQELLLIDSAGINPHSGDDRRELAGLVAAGAAEPLLVLAAGGDAADTLDMATAFRDLGCSRMIVTRLDIGRRLGSILGVAAALRLGFAEAGISPSIADGLASFNPVVLARLLLSAAPQPPQPSRQRGES